jgi:CelD/BcsL family acetyltransferase involved in cellulose biosynthesis
VDYIRNHWRKLEADAVGHSIFQNWEWIECWLEVAKQHVRPLIFKDNNQKIIGICFVGFSSIYDLKIFGFRTLFPFLSGVPSIDILASEYNQILCLPEYRLIVHELLVDFLLKSDQMKQYSRILLRRVPDEFLEIYKNVAERNNCIFKIFKTEPSAYTDLKSLQEEKLPYDDYFSKSLKSDIRRSEKLYREKYGELKLEKSTNVTQAQNWFQEIGKLNRLRFQDKYKKVAWDYPELVQVNRAFLNRQFSSGKVEIIRLCAGANPIGYLLNFIYRDVVYFYMCGFRYEEDNRLKPGLLMHNYAIQEYYKQGLHKYDFMAGDQHYKYRMGKQGVTMHHFTISRKSFKLKCVHVLTAIKDMIKK